MACCLPEGIPELISIMQTFQDGGCKDSDNVVGLLSRGRGRVHWDRWRQSFGGRLAFIRQTTQVHLRQRDRQSRRMFGGSGSSFLTCWTPASPD